MTERFNPKILYAWQHKEWGGAQIHFLQLAKELRKNFEAEFAFPEQGSAGFNTLLSTQGFVHHKLPDREDSKPLLGLLSKLGFHLKKLRRDISDARILLGKEWDVIHVDAGPWSNLTFLFLLSLKGPVFYTMHNRVTAPGAFRKLVWLLKHHLLAMLPRIYCLASNQDAKRGLRGTAPEWWIDSVKVTYTHVDLNEIDGVTKNLGEAEHEGFEICTVGAFIERKGFRVLLTALQALKETKPNVRALWIGPGELSDEQNRMISSFGLGEMFKYISMSELQNSRTKLLTLVASARLFCLPSYIEGLPIAVLESMALGTAVITTDVYGIPEAVTHGGSGYLISPGDSENLCRVFNQLLSSPNESVGVTTAARKVVEDRFNSSVVARTLSSAYQSVL